MGMIMMMKRQCVCGEWDRITLVTGNVPFGKKFYYVKCPGCGRHTAKHTGAEEAVREWNHMEDIHEPEDETGAEAAGADSQAETQGAG